MRRLNYSQISMDSWGPFIAGAFGFWFALYRFGINALNPVNLGWLTKDDHSQHFAGAHAFRFDDWQWPIGYTSTLDYPFGSSVALTDSIPILGFLTKILSPMLPVDFQYIGMWLFLCHFLQGFFAYLLMYTVCKRWQICLLSACIFVLSPPHLFRFIHPALSGGHWLVIAALWIYMNDAKLKNARFTVRAWCALLVLTSFIHVYPAIMVLSFAVANMGHHLVSGRVGYIRVLGLLIIYPLILLTGWYLSGLFLEGINPNLSGFGVYSMNLNALFNGMGKVNLGPNFPVGTGGQYEGYSYLGAGCIILGLFLLLDVLLRKTDVETNIYWRSYFLHWPLICIMVLLFVFSLSDEVYWFKIKVLSWEFLDQGVLSRVCSSLRASGRFCWPIYYLIYFIILSQIYFRLGYSRALPLIALGFIMQFADLYDAPILQKVSQKEAKQKFLRYLRDPVWKLAAEKFDNVIIVPSFRGKILFYRDANEFVYIFGTKGSKLTAGDTARKPYRVVEEERKIRQHILSEDLDSRSIYIFTTRVVRGALRRALKKKATCYFWDSYVVCHDKNIEEPFPKQRSIDVFRFM